MKKRLVAAEKSCQVKKIELYFGEEIDHENTCRRSV